MKHRIACVVLDRHGEYKPRLQPSRSDKVLFTADRRNMASFWFITTRFEDRKPVGTPADLVRQMIWESNEDFYFRAPLPGPCVDGFHHDGDLWR